MNVGKGFCHIKILIAAMAIVGFTSTGFSETRLWQDIHSVASSNSEAQLRVASGKSVYQQALMIKLDTQQMQTRLDESLQNNSDKVSAKHTNAQSVSANSKTIPLPLPNGSITHVKVVAESLLPSVLANKFPQIRTYKVLANKELVTGRLDLTPNGFHAMLETREGEIILIDPVNSSDNVYASYKKSEQHQSPDATFSCGAKYSSNASQNNLQMSMQRPFAEEKHSVLVYRVAIATTGEYTAKHGGTVEGAMAAISTTLNRINQVLERDLGIHLSLVENNDQLINLDAESDPFTGTTQVERVRQNQSFIDAVIGNDNYDIGHLFATSGGGLAAIGSVCNERDKAKGISGISNPQNDSFNLDFVAHEIGHQLGATHTFNSTQGLCGGDSREGITAFEPGSGSTIMSYAGYCGTDNLQSHTDAMFHIGSIEQIQSVTLNGNGSQCGTRLSLQNRPPVPDAGKDYVIPARTPFKLSGKATDPDGDTLVFGWEQIDAGDSSAAEKDTGNNALFRAYMPSLKKERSFPPLQDILNHTSIKGEALPDSQRQLNFSFVAQDRYSIAQADEMVVQVHRTGSRFALNMPRSYYQAGDTHKVLWNVANTDLAPINCENVDLSLSLDGGSHFDIELARNLPNTGEAWVTIPADTEETTEGRFKLSCSDNIFFAISYRNFLVTKETPIDPVVFTDEDQPEQGLDDSVINEASNDSSTANNSSNEGGGTIFGLLFLLLPLLAIRRRYFFKLSKNNFLMN